MKPYPTTPIFDDLLPINVQPGSPDHFALKLRPAHSAFDALSDK
jgi:hypothetical protein